MKLPEIISSRIFCAPLITLTSTIAIFASFHAFDTFEQLYELTRHYAEMELDEYVLNLLSLPLPIAWFAYRRTREVLEGTVKQADLENTWLSRENCNRLER